MPMVRRRARKNSSDPRAVRPLMCPGTELVARHPGAPRQLINAPYARRIFAFVCDRFLEILRLRGAAHRSMRWKFSRGYVACSELSAARFRTACHAMNAARGEGVRAIGRLARASVRSSRRSASSALSNFRMRISAVPSGNLPEISIRARCRRTSRRASCLRPLRSSCESRYASASGVNSSAQKASIVSRGQ